MQYTEIFLALKIENFQLKNFDMFSYFCSKHKLWRGGSNEYPQSMVWSQNKKNRYTPAYPSFAIIKVGFKGVYIARTCFRDDTVLEPASKN